MFFLIGLKDNENLYRRIPDDDKHRQTVLQGVYSRYELALLLI